MDDAEINKVLDREQGWQLIAKKLTDAVYVRHLTESKQRHRWDRDDYELDKSLAAATIVYARWLKQINQGNFLWNMQTDKGRTSSLYDQVYAYFAGGAMRLTRITVGKKWRRQLVGARTDKDERMGRVPADRSNPVDADDWIDDLHGLDPEDRCIILESRQLPSPQLQSVPQRPSKEWLTAIHMSWPGLQIKDTSEQELLNQALKELHSDAQYPSNDERLRNESERAQTLLGQELAQCQQAERTCWDAIAHAWHALQTHDAKASGIEGGNREHKEEKLRRAQEKHRIAEQKAVRLAVERLVMQFRPPAYAMLFGRVRANDNDQKRRSRYRHKMNDIFVYGDRYQPHLRLHAGEGGDHEE